MNKEPLLLVFENDTPIAPHLAALKQRSRVLRLVDAPTASDMSWLQHSHLQSREGPPCFAGPLGDTRYLLELRDFHFFSPFVVKFDFEILIYGGRSAQVMPQYYIFKKLVTDRSKVAIYSPQGADGIKGFHDVLGDAAFDGHSHQFKVDASRLGFDVLVEGSND